MSSKINLLFIINNKHELKLLYDYLSNLISDTSDKMHHIYVYYTFKITREEKQYIYSTIYQKNNYDMFIFQVSDKNTIDLVKKNLSKSVTQIIHCDIYHSCKYNLSDIWNEKVVDDNYNVLHVEPDNSPQITIDFVKLNKNESIKLVEPNFIYNRYDIFYDNQYELIEIKADNETYYVPIRIDVYTAKIGVYMTPLPKEAFNKLIDFVFKHYTEVDFIEVKHSLNAYSGLNEGNQWTIELPKTEEQYINSLGKKTRMHIKQYFKYIERDFRVEFKTYEKDIPTEIISTYYKFKKDTLNHTYKMPEKDYLREYQITKSHVLYLNDKIAAMSFICEIEDSKNIYYENFSYDREYSKYSLGTVITYYTIKKLIEDGCKNFYLAGGNYLYKQNLSTKLDKTYNGIIKRKNGKHILKRAFFQFGQNDTFYFLRLFGLKLKKRKEIKCVK